MNGNPIRRCIHGKLFSESCPGCGYVHPRDQLTPTPEPMMTERPFAAAIAATIPPGDPDSQARMEWCKDAADAIAQTCLDHAAVTPGDVSPGAVALACDGIRAAFEHAMGYLRKKAIGR